MTLSLGWTLLVLLAAVMHAAWNVLVKFGDDALVNMTLIMGMAGVIALAFTPFVSTSPIRRAGSSCWARC